MLILAFILCKCFSVAGRGGNRVLSPRGGAVMGSKVCGAVTGRQARGAGRVRVFKLYARGGSGVTVVTPRHSLDVLLW